MKIIIHSNRDVVREYYDRGLSVKEIAKRVGISDKRVYQLLKLMDLPVPTKRDKVKKNTSNTTKGE